MNLEEVARRAKVSTATVSRVLNQSSSVKGSTRDRVMKAVRDLNYQPNLHARSLAVGKTRSIGIIVSNMENPFFYDIVRQIEGDAHAQGYEVIVSNTNYDADQLARSVRLMAGRRVAGLAAVVSEMEPHLVEYLAGARIPVVFYDVGPNAENVGRIRLNYRKGMHRLAEYLVAMGHDRSLAWLGHHRDYGPLKERREALIEAYDRLAPSAEVRSFAGRDSLEGGWQVAREMLQSGYKPTVVVCANDFMAVGVLRALRENGISVPKDISVTGLDNIRLAEFCYPTLTTVHVPRDRIGRLIFEKVMGGIDAPGFTTELLIDPDLVIRDSTGPAAR